jgi:AcrR family transcriptional regulator
MYHDLVFEAAEWVFGQKSFEHATMQDIAGEAGISLKTLYSVFPGKDDLYEEIQRVRGQAFVGHVARAIDPRAAPLDQLEQLVTAYVDFLFEHRDWLRIHLQSRISWGMRPTEEYAADYWEEGLTTLGAILRDGAASGIFYPGDERSAAALVQSILQTLVSQAVARDEQDVAKTAEEIGVQLRRLLCTPESSH